MRATVKDSNTRRRNSLMEVRRPVRKTPRFRSRPDARCWSIITGSALVPVCVDDPAHPLPATSAHNPSAWLGRAVGVLTSAFGWLMCTLATGAVSAFAAIVIGIPPSWWVLVLAAPLTVVLKFCGCLYARWAGPVAAFAVLVAGFYAACLVALARIAAVTGFPFGLAFHTGGFGLVLQVEKLGLSAPSILVYAGAAVLAFMLAAWLVRLTASR